MPKVLIVDDEESVRFLCNAVLSRKGIEASTAFDGRQALSTLKEDDTYQFVVSDLNMPHMMGDELIDIINNTYPKIKTLLWSTIGDEDKGIMTKDPMSKEFLGFFNLESI